MTETEQSVYEMIGGTETFRRLVDAFYKRVEADEYLRPMFPEDLEPGKYWQMLFLIQFFGGPTQYIEDRGHPRLRMRHAPFVIDQKGRDHWFTHMCEAIDEVGIQEPARTTMRDYFERGSSFMINADQNTPNLMHWQKPPKDQST
ncbi:MAG: globin [Chloroflexi bacterium]|nr:globin [Chloroflexota bacterium]MCC6891200.1 globin [Anaerolineae bacterium]